MAKKIDYASMYTLRKDGRYMGSYTDASGRHFVYDRDPERLWHKLNDPKAEEVITFAMDADAWEREHREQIGARTWKNYEPHYIDIVQQHGSKPISEITAADIAADLQRAKAKKYSATIVKTRLAIYNGILNYAALNRHIAFNPGMTVKLPKNLPRGKRRAPTDDEIRTICENIDAPFGFFVFFLLCTGLRKSEALALTRSDIDLKEKEVTISKALEYADSAHPTVKTPKTENGNRVIPIVDVLVEPLKEHLQATDSVCLFPGRNGYLSKRGYDCAWQRYCETVGFVDDEGKCTITAHVLRHGTATLLYEAQVDVYTAQAILGHANVQTTMAIYTELREKQKKKSVKRFDKSLSKMLSKSRKHA